jgi:hypothetical protein
MDLGSFERLFESERRQDGRHALGQHGLTRAGRADHEDVVATGTGNFESTLGGLLAANVLEIHKEVL